jgi:putative endonuclease
MRTTQHYVYIATNRSGTLYTGMTSDLKHRLAQHREGLSPFTAKYRIGRLLYYEVAVDRYTALEREWQIKRWNRAKKLALVRGVNPRLRDLSRDLGFADGRRCG